MTSQSTSKTSTQKWKTTCFKFELMSVAGSFTGSILPSSSERGKVAYCSFFIVFTINISSFRMESDECLHYTNKSLSLAVLLKDPYLKQ